MSVADAANPPIAFTVSAPKPETHLFQIRMQVPAVADKGRFLDLVLPSWTPGSYAIRDFARNVEGLEVLDARGDRLPVEKVEKGRWRVSVPATAGALDVRYRVYANELSVRTSHVDASHAHGNGAGLFLYVEGRKESPQRLRFELPGGWRTSIALPERDGAFEARDYDELVDSPFECGTHRTFDFTVRGKPHTIALWGQGNEDPARLVQDLAGIVEAASQVFGGELPYERYLFIVHLSAGGGGGLEHRATQVDGIAPWRFKPEKSYRGVLSLFSHELFHAWNVKRIHPAPLGPFDYTKEVYTRDLWAMEGVTSYYEGLLLVRAGLVTPKQQMEEWTKELKAHRDNPGTGMQSAEQASFDAWIRFYRPDENSPNVSESYYRRGSLIGLALDLTIRSRTNGRASLDDVLRALWRDFGSKGASYPDGAWERAVDGLVPGEAKAFFDRYVRGVESPHLEALSAAFGLALSEKAEKDEDADEPEGKTNGNGSAPKPVPSKGDLGWKTKNESGRITVTEVYRGRAAHEAGINAGDELVAVDGFKVDDDQLKRIARDLGPGSRVAVTLFRRSRLLEIPLTLGTRRAFTYELKPVESASDTARALYQGWLGVPWKGKEKDEPKGPQGVDDKEPR